MDPSSDIQVPPPLDHTATSKSAVSKPPISQIPLQTRFGTLEPLRKLLLLVFFRIVYLSPSVYFGLTREFRPMSLSMCYGLVPI